MEPKEILMNEQTIIRIDGDLYEVGNRYKHSPKGDSTLGSIGGRPSRVISSGGQCYDGYFALTPLPPDSEFAKKIRLGTAAFNSVKPELRDRIMGEFRPVPHGSGEYFARSHAEDMGNEAGPNCGVTWSSSNVILLAPPPQKTDRDVLRDIEIEILGFIGKDGGYGKLRKIQDRIKQHLEANNA